jgi:hypothetical protein
VKEDLKEVAAEGFVRFLPVALVTAELGAREALGLGTRDSGAHEIVSPVLEMGAKLLIRVIGHLRMMKKSGSRTEVSEAPHVSSG